MQGQKRRSRTGARISRDRRDKALRRGATRFVPVATREHLRAAMRESLLALASLCEAALKAVEGSARITRHRIERIPVKKTQ